MFRPCLLLSAILTAPVVANSAPVGLSDFDTPIIEEFDFTTFDVVAGPIVLGGVTYSSNNGQLRAFADTASFANCFGGCITSDTDLGFIDAIFDDPFQRVGAFVGSAAQPNSARVDFFDVLDGLIASATFGSGDAGDVFVGFEAAAGIKRVRFTDIANQGFVLSVDRLHRENIPVVPLPAAMTLLLGSLGLLYMYRIKTRTKTNIE